MHEYIDFMFNMRLSLVLFLQKTWTVKHATPLKWENNEQLSSTV